jgi:hypothetical protein
MAIERRELEKKLKGKFGFKHSKKLGADHIWYELEIANGRLITTKISHSNPKTIAGSLESCIARELRVRTSYLRDMIACKIGKEEYIPKVVTEPFVC